MSKEAILLAKDDHRISAVVNLIEEEKRRMDQRFKFLQKQIIDSASVHFDIIDKLEDELFVILTEKSLVTKEQCKNECIHIESGVVFRCTDHPPRDRNGAYRFSIDLAFKRRGRSE